MKNKIINEILVISFFAVIGILVFLPIINNLDSKIFGNQIVSQDGYQHIWNFWWAKKTCLGFCGDFWNTNYLFFPKTVSLLFHNFSFFNLTLFLPLLLMGLKPIVAYNISFIVAICLSGYFMYLLVRHLTCNNRAAVISGAIYSLSPFLIGHLKDGQLDHATIQFFPLWILFLIKSREDKKIIFPIISGLLLFIIGTDFSLLIAAIIIWIIWFIFDLFVNKKFYESIRINLLSLSFFLLPFLIFFHKTLTSSELFNLKGATKLTSSYFSSDLMAFFIPTKNTLLGFINKANFQGINSDNAVFIGFGGLILLLSSLFLNFKKQKNHYFYFWLSLIIVGLIFSLGPELKILGQNIEWVKIMPYSLIEKVPLINILRTPSRLAIIVFIGLSVLASFGYIAIEKKLKNVDKNLLFFIIISLIVVEIFPYKINVNEIITPSVYKRIEKDSDDFAVLEFPTLWANGLEFKRNFEPRYMYYQTEHEKKIAGGYLTRIENDITNSYKNEPMLNYFFTEEIKYGLSEEHLKIINTYKENNLEEIISNNHFKYLIINKKMLNNFTQEANIKKSIGKLSNYVEIIEEDSDFALYKFK